jgi:hypothetical protein
MYILLYNILYVIYYCTYMWMYWAGGLHFWVDSDDAVAYAQECGINHYWACY